MSAVPQTAATPAVGIAVRAIARRFALPFVFVASFAYQAALGARHVAPTVFNDELMYGKLSQSLAAGHGFTIRGEHYVFPGVVAPLLQAPAWLFGSTLDGYAAAKIINALLMSAAVFPAYWLARRYMRTSFALAVAFATVATPAMVYHAYLMSEAVAYPIFVLTVAVIVRAVEKPSRRLGVALPLVCALAVATRVQFLALPVAYVVAVAVCSRRREHVLPLGLLAALGSVLVLAPQALGTYSTPGNYSYGAGNVAHWAVTNASLLPFSLGLAIVPGAILGLVFGRRRVFAVVTATITAAFLAQAALISAGEAGRPLERYLFYLTPLAFTAFFLYVERGAPRRVLHLGLAGVVAVALSQVSLAGLTGTAAFFFDSVTESAYAQAAYRLGLGNASLLFALVPLALAAFASAVPLRRPHAALAVAGTAIAVQLAAGVAVAATDRLTTEWSQRQFAGSPPNWLDVSNLGPARYVVLPNSNPFLGTSLEIWNRKIKGLVVLQAPAPDAFASAVARVRPDGTLEIDGRPLQRAELLVANVSGSRVGWDADVVARPRAGLIAYRLHRNARVHWIARGLAEDGWTSQHVRYSVWPNRPVRNGHYLVELALPPNIKARGVEIHTAGGPARTVTIRPGARVRFVIPAPGVRPPALHIYVHVPPGPLESRTLGVRVLELRYAAVR